MVADGRLKEVAKLSYSVSLLWNKSGNDSILSFPTTSRDLYTVRTRPDLVLQWTNSRSVVPGDGTVKIVTMTNAISGD